MCKQSTGWSQKNKRKLLPANSTFLGAKHGAKAHAQYHTNYSDLIGSYSCSTWHFKLPWGKMNSPHCTVSFWGGIVLKNWSSRHCLTRFNILRHFVTARFNARLLKVQLSLKGATLKCTVCFPFLNDFLIMKLVETFLSHILQSSMIKMAL